MSTSFQRCTDRGMGARLRQDNMVFGAPDEPEATPRQLRGAALAGSVAGAIMGGPVVAATVAVGAVYAAAKDDGGLGDAARSMGDLASNLSEKTGKAIERKVKRTLSRSSSFKFKDNPSDDRLEDEVRRREAELRMSSSTSNQGEPANNFARLRRFSSSVIKHIKGGQNNRKSLQDNQAERASGNHYTFQTRSSPLVSAASNTRPQDTSREPKSEGRWKRLGRSLSFKSKQNSNRDSVDEYVAKAKAASSSYHRKSQYRHERAMSTNTTRAIEVHESKQPSIVYRIVKRTVQPYSLSADEMRALAHHVASQVLATLANCRPVMAVRGSKVGIGVKENYITSGDLRLIAKHISHEVKAAAENSEYIKENALSDSEVVTLARHIVHQVMIAVSNCSTIQERQLSASEMQSLAWFVKDQAQNQALNAIQLSAKEMRSLACYLKLQAQMGLAGGLKGRAAKEHLMLASDMDDFITSMEEQSMASTSKSRSRMHQSRYDSKEDSYSDDSDGSYCSESTGSYDDEDEWSGNEGGGRRDPRYDSRRYEKRVKKLSSRNNRGPCIDFESDDSRSDDGDYSEDDSAYDDYTEDGSYVSDDCSYDSRRRDDDSRCSYDSRIEDDCSRSSYDSRGGREHAKDHGRHKGGGGRHEVCNENCDVVERKEPNAIEKSRGVPQKHEPASSGNDSDDDFQDAVEDSSGKQEKKKDTEYVVTGLNSEEEKKEEDIEEARELALQIIEKMLLD